MKHIYTTLILLLGIAQSLQVSAQDLNNLAPVAWYTLIDSTGDKLELKPEAELTNAPFEGSDGVYSNGLYLYSGTPGGCLVTTPNLPELYDSSFAVSLQFRIDSLDGESHPIMIIGDSWRYLGLSLLYDDRWVIDFNGYAYALPGTKALAGQWYEVTIMYSADDSTAFYYLDGAIISEHKGPLIRDLNDGRISNTNSGQARTFRGNWRNLRIFSSDELSSPIYQPQQIRNFQIFPNPTHGHLVITQQDDRYDYWEIMDLTHPNPVMQGTWTSSLMEIQMASLPAGLYLFKALNRTSQEIRTRLFVKQ